MHVNHLRIALGHRSSGPAAAPQWCVPQAFHRDGCVAGSVLLIQAPGFVPQGLRSERIFKVLVAKTQIAELYFWSVWLSVRWGSQSCISSKFPDGVRGCQGITWSQPQIQPVCKLLSLGNASHHLCVTKGEWEPALAHAFIRASWPGRLKITASWPFTEKVCPPLI